MERKGVCEIPLHRELRFIPAPVEFEVGAAVGAD